MRNNHIALPLCPTNSRAVHWAVSIAPTPSACNVIQALGLPFSTLLDSLALICINWLRAGSRVYTDTELTISANSLLTTTSQSYRDFTISLEVKVPTYILSHHWARKILPSFPPYAAALSVGSLGGMR